MSLSIFLNALFADPNHWNMMWNMEVYKIAFIAMTVTPNGKLTGKVRISRSNISYSWKLEIQRSIVI